MTDDENAPIATQNEAIERAPRTGLWILALLLASGAYAIYSDPGARELDSFALGVALGGGLPIFAIAAVPALIVWAFARFRRERVRLLLGTWTVSLVAVVVLAEVARDFGKTISRDYLMERTRSEPQDTGAFAGRDRVDFIRMTVAECVRSQESSALNRSIGIDSDLIELYCLCTAETLANTMTVDELKYMYLNNESLSPSARAKSDQAASNCIEEATR